jgi:hypothetical protein
MRLTGTGTTRMRALTASAKFSGWSAPTVARELSDLPRPFLSSPHHNLLGDKLVAMLEQMTQQPLIYDYVRGYF